jgi:NTE family protein
MRPPKTALAMTLQAASLLVQQRLISEVRELQDNIDLRVIPPPCPLDVSPADFSHGHELIERSRALAGSWLDAFDSVGSSRPRDGMHPHDAV